MSWRLPRRTFLRGAGASIALPFLEVMTPRVARGQSAALEPKRTMIFHFGNGLHMRSFTPFGGARIATDTPVPMDASVSELIGIFFTHGLGSDINVVTGLANEHVDNDQHALRTLLTSVDNGNGPSVDQIIAQRNSPGGAGLPSLFVAPFVGFELAATMMCYADAGDANAVRPYTDPGSLFTRLFGAAPGGQADDRPRQRRGSILDYVGDSIAYVKSRASASDLTLLDQHLTVVRSLEQRLQAPPPTCDEPGAAINLAAGTSPDERQAWFDVMAELAVVALQCDLTRTAVVCLTATGVDGIVWAPGYEHHQVSHYDIIDGAGATYQWQDPGAIDRALSASTFQVTRMAETLAKLKQRQSGNGQSLLDNTAFVGLSEFSAADLHSRLYLPVITAGLGMTGGNVVTHPCFLSNIGGGTPAPGAQLDNSNWVSHGMPQNCAENGDNVPLANLWLTLLRAMGVGADVAPSHGNSTGTLNHLWAPAA